MICSKMHTYIRDSYATCIFIKIQFLISSHHMKQSKHKADWAILFAVILWLVQVKKMDLLKKKETSAELGIAFLIGKPWLWETGYKR